MFGVLGIYNFERNIKNIKLPTLNLDKLWRLADRKLTNKAKLWQSNDNWIAVKKGEAFHIKNTTKNKVLGTTKDGKATLQNLNGEFLKKNNVKRQQKFANLILFQVKLKDGN